MILFDINLQSLFDYRCVFNPTITRNDDGSHLLICRLQNHPLEGYLGLCHLDSHFKPVSLLAIIKTSPVLPDSPAIMLEDPRSFVDKGRVFLYHVESSSAVFYLSYTIFSQLTNDSSLENGILLEYKKNGKAFNAVKKISKAHNRKKLPNEDWLIEKNWQFFMSASKHYCIYQIQKKHEIFRFDFPSGVIQKKYITYSNLSWEFGRMSGGAAPVLHEDGNYYSFFHSWTEWKTPDVKRSWTQRKYHIGVYTFENYPPFRIKMISKNPLMSASDDEGSADSGHAVVFPGSAFFDQETRMWNIALGWNDKSCKMLQINHTDIVHQLVPVSRLSTGTVLWNELIVISSRIFAMPVNIYRSLKSRVR